MSTFQPCRLPTLTFLFVLLCLQPSRASLLLEPGSACLAYGYNASAPGVPTSATAVLGVAGYGTAVPSTYPTCFPSPHANDGVLYTLSGIVTSLSPLSPAALGLGLAFQATLQASSVYGSLPSLGSALEISFSSTYVPSPTISRGDSITISGYALQV